MRLFSIDCTGSACIKFFGKALITFFDNILMSLSPENFKCDCNRDDLVVREFTNEVLKDIKGSEFGSKYIKFLQEKYPDKFEGFAYYSQDGKPCGYICGVKPECNVRLYRVRNCDFFVKFVYVFDEFRGERIASKLFQQLFLRINGKEVIFSVRKNNISAIKSYIRAGAEEKCRKKFVRVMKINLPYYKV